MSPTDLKFHQKLLRLLKGALRAYEEWLDEKQVAEHENSKRAA